MRKKKVKTMGFHTHNTRETEMIAPAITQNDSESIQNQSGSDKKYNKPDVVTGKRVYRPTEKSMNNTNNSIITTHNGTRADKLKLEMINIKNNVLRNLSNQSLNESENSRVVIQKDRFNSCSELEKSRQSDDSPHNPVQLGFGTFTDLLEGSRREPSYCYNHEFLRYTPFNCQLIAKYQVNNFSELSTFLKKLFLDRLACNHDIVLNCEEIMIFTAILKKKFDVELPISNIYSVDFLFDADYIRTRKRPEECYKFVFKHTFKNLKRVYCDAQIDQQILNRKSVKIVDFYEYYFGNLSQTINVPISHFYLPLTPDSYCNKGKNSVAKTINMAYVNLITKSKHFMSDFEDYLDNKFIANYSQLINLKIDHMVEKWNEISLCMNQSERSLFFICDYIKTNKKCKLPWTVSEVRIAIETVMKMIKKSADSRYEIA